MEKIFVSIDFMSKIFHKYEHYTIKHFEADPSIDIESFLFFKNIISNRCDLYINLTQERIDYFIDKKNDLNLLTEEEKDLSDLYGATGKSITRAKSCYTIYEAIKNKEFDGEMSDLPNTILLSYVDKDICKEIEKKYGINCFSLNRLKVDVKYRSAWQYVLGNTHKDLIEKLYKYPFNRIEIYDNYLLKNADKFNNYIWNKLNEDNKLLNENIKLNCIGKDVDVKTEEKNKEHLKKILPGHTYNDTSQHDRIIKTNTFKANLGSSININNSTYLNVFPTIIYGK